MQSHCRGTAQPSTPAIAHLHGSPHLETELPPKRE
jgi:hypothetical protein